MLNAAVRLLLLFSMQKPRNILVKLRSQTRIVHHDCSSMQSLPKISDYMASDSIASKTVSRVSSHSSYSLEDDFLCQNERKTLEELKDAKEEGKCVVLATIKSLVKNSKWWYSACPNTKCNRKVFLDDDMWYCMKCKKHWPAPIQKMYKLEVIAMDDTDAAAFIIFGKEGDRMLGVSASDLVQPIENRGQDAADYPLELDDLIDKKMLFKINIKKANIDSAETATYHVLKICNDEDVISSFVKHHGSDKIEQQVSPCESLNN